VTGGRLDDIERPEWAACHDCNGVDDLAATGPTEQSTRKLIVLLSAGKTGASSVADETGLFDLEKERWARENDFARRWIDKSQRRARASALASTT
jgi:hypothetical protein